MDWPQTFMKYNKQKGGLSYIYTALGKLPKSYSKLCAISDTLMLNRLTSGFTQKQKMAQENVYINLV